MYQLKDKDTFQLLDQLLEIAKQAGHGILPFYQKEVDVVTKEDDSPVTAADHAAHKIIESSLLALPYEFPIVSEESDELLKPDGIASGDYFWLVDPLDGTKEFINHSDEFTVNIALIHQHKPVIGVVYAPAKDWMYWGGRKVGSFFRSEDGDPQRLQTTTIESPINIMGSRRHGLEKLNAFMENIGKNYDVNLVSMGSSLKACQIAAGNADAYLRFGPTCEWDTAACHAVLEGAGGEILGLEGEPLLYQKGDPKWLNPGFIALGTDSNFWLSQLKV